MEGVISLYRQNNDTYINNPIPGGGGMGRSNNHFSREGILNAPPSFYYEFRKL